MHDAIVTETLAVDVLVIGGGAAGTRAAVEASDSGLDVAILCKGMIGKSGCSIFAGNLNWFNPRNDSLDASSDERTRHMMEFNCRYTHYLGDQRYMKDAIDFTASDFYPWLEERGIRLLRDSDQTLITDEPAHTSVWSVKQGYSGQVIMRLMREEVQQRPIRVIEHASAISLLRGGGRVAGCAAVDYRHGKLLVIRAKSVILATGHNNYLAKRSTGTREGAANGWIIGYRAGVPLQNIEMQWFHASDIAAPASWMRLHLYPNPMPKTSRRTRLVNSGGDEFFDGERDAYQSVPYIMQMKAVIKEVKGGRARFDGGYSTSYRHVDQDLLRRYVAPAEALSKLGIAPATDLIENGATWHMNVGGLRVDGATMASSVPGLFIAGSVSALITGGLANVTLDAIRAAASARDHCAAVGHGALDAGEAEAAHDRVRRLLRRRPASGGLLPAQVKNAIRQVMWDYAGPVKTAATLAGGREALRAIREELVPAMGMDEMTLRANFDLVEAIDVADMLDVCDLVLQFSAYRQESRGSFYRDDYPFTDNESWLVHVIGSKDEAGTLKLQTAPVDLAYARPPETGKSDFFSLDY